MPCTRAPIRIDAPGDIRILPGVAQARPDRPDVMRGEETQLLGVTEPDFTGLVCIPGTHSKWVRIEAGRIVEFSTYMTGELFSVIARHSILAHAVETANDEAGSALRRTARPSVTALRRRWRRPLP